MIKNILTGLIIGSFASGVLCAAEPVRPAAPVASPTLEEKPRLGDIPDPAAIPTQPTPKPVSPSPKSPEKPRLGDIPEEPLREKKEKKPTSGSLENITPEDRKKLLEDVAREFYEKGEIAYQAGRLVEARDLFERALTLQPNYPIVRVRLESVIRALEPTEQDAPAPEKDPKKVLIARLTSELDQAIKNKDWDRAERHVKSILAVDPANEVAKSKSKTIHRNLALRAADRAQAREKAGDFQGAVDAYRVAVSYSHDPAYTDKIESLMEKITDVNNRKSDELYRQALDASQNGNNEKAIDLCKEALQLNADNIQARRMLDRLQSRTP